MRRTQSHDIQHYITLHTTAIPHIPIDKLAFFTEDTLYAGFEKVIMSEVTFAKTFLATTDKKPIKLPADHVSDPRKYPGQSPVRPSLYHHVLIIAPLLTPLFSLSSLARPTRSPPAPHPPRHPKHKKRQSQRA